MKKICKNCQMFFPHSKQTVGECRRYSPKSDFRFPRIFYDMYCGDFMAAHEEVKDVE